MKKIKTEEINLINEKLQEAVQRAGENKEKTYLRDSFYFKGRKPINVASALISLITKPGDRIVDPFMGGGSFILAALESERFITGMELDSYTFDALKTIFTKVDANLLNQYFEKIELGIKHKVLELYRTKCCGYENYIKTLFFDPEYGEYFNPEPHRDIKDGKNIKLVNKCPGCHSKSKQFDQFDQSILEESLKLDNSKFPHRYFIENSRINLTKTTGAHSYKHLFSERNQHALLLIQNEISNLPESNEKRFIQHALVSSLALSKVTMYGSSTDNLYHILRTKAQDANVWLQFENKFNRMCKFQEAYSKYLVEDVSDNLLMKLCKGSFDQILANDSEEYDLIYTDFPYTDQVPYLERNQLFRIWLEEFVDKDQYEISPEDLNNEIVQTNAPSRKNKQTLEQFYNSVDNMFNKFYQNLKEDKFVVLTMSLGSKKYIRTYSHIVNLARKNGFEYISRSNIDKNNPSLRKQSAYANTILDEVIVVFKKLKPTDRYWYEGDTNYEFQATKLIYNHIKNSNDKDINKSKLINLIWKDMISKEFIPNEETVRKANRVIEDNFVVTKNNSIVIDNNKLYIEVESQSTLFTKLYDLIPLYIKKFFKAQGKFTLQDLYLMLTNDLFLKDPNALSMLIKENETYERDIRNLIMNYCDLDNGYYIPKKISNINHKDGTDISQFEGTEFEILIKNLLEKEGYFDLFIIGGAGDRGVDIIGKIMSDKTVETHIFQCKRWISKVGSTPIQRLFAEKEYHSFEKAFCITTSDFTEEGSDALERHKVEGWNGWTVQKLLNKYYPEKYYNKALDIQ